MFNNLFEFYRSTEWQKFLAVLKNERTNEKGEIICEYCGKPITKPYDVIGHHKTELTEENVKDYNISLNPENVAFVHHRCHNYIHNKLGHNCRQVFLVYGAPMAGKTTWVNDNKVEGDLVVDMDNIWQCISGCDRYVKPKRLNAIAFAVRSTLIDAIKYRLGKWNNAYIVGGYPLSSERERLCKELGARLVYIESNKEECLQRLANSEGRDAGEWERYIKEWFEKYC